MRSSQACGSSSVFISKNKKWDFGRFSHSLKVTQLKSSPSSSSSQSSPSSESLFVIYSAPYTAHMTFHMEQETREVQVPQWRPSIVKEKKRETQDSNSTFITPSSMLLPLLSCLHPSARPTVKLTGFWRKVLTHKIDGDSWESKKEIAPALTQEEADEIRKQEILLAISYLWNTNI